MAEGACGCAHGPGLADRQERLERPRRQVPSRKTPALPLVTMLILAEGWLSTGANAMRPVSVHPGILLAAMVHGNRRRRNPVLMARMTLETKR